MAFHTARGIFAGLLVVCIGHICIQTSAATTLSLDKARHAMDTAFRIAHSELADQTSLNEELFRSGIDDNGQEYGHRHMLSLFRFMRKSSVSGAEHAFVVLRATQELKKRLGKSVDDMLMHPELRHMWGAMIRPFCSPRETRCTKGFYREADGSCNNLDYPTWGMSSRQQKRYLQPVYEDDVSVPRMYSVTGKLLPSPRIVSNTIHKAATSNLLEPHDTYLLMQWGQVLDHDIADTPTMKGFDGADVRCCGIDEDVLNKRPACFSIHIPHGDSHFPKPCMNFVRSAPTTNDDCAFGRRNQMNQATSYIDASHVYGADADAMQELRAMKHGFLKMNSYGFFGPNENQERCMKEHPGDYCMKSGDARMHIVPGQTSIQILFLREHNRIAGILGKINKHWDDERIFQETRKIIAAINQHITYTEYLPIILGPVHMDKYGLHSTKFGFNTAYNPTIDPTIANSFAGAAFRFGHSQIPADVGLMYKNGMKKNVHVQATFNRPSTVLSGDGTGSDNHNRWMANQRCARSDRFLEAGVRDYLFLDRNGESFDLASLNIQRGRDHGLPGYNKWRKWCGLQPAFHFGTGPGGLVDMHPEAAMLLASVYKHPDDIDLYPGGLSERHMGGAAMGPVFACINARQFKDLKYGDRYWYENKFAGTGFSEPQINEIKRLRLSGVMCRNMNEKIMTRNVFQMPSARNPHIPCKEMPDIDFGFWREAPIMHKFPAPFAALAPLTVYR